jgi:hypothetical protein
MVSDYAIKSIPLVDFMNVTGSAIAVPFPREIKIPINAKVFNDLRRSGPGSKREGCASHCSFGEEFCGIGSDLILGLAL